MEGSDALLEAGDVEAMIARTTSAQHTMIHVIHFGVNFVGVISIEQVVVVRCCGACEVHCRSRSEYALEGEWAAVTPDPAKTPRR